MVLSGMTPWSNLLRTTTLTDQRGRRATRTASKVPALLSRHSPHGFDNGNPQEYQG